MHRRAFLRAVGASVGLGLGATASGTVAGHPTPTDDGSGAAPTGTATEGEPLGRLPMETVYETVTSPDGHTAYVATGDGLALVDVTTPSAPFELARRTDLLDGEDGPMQRVQDLALAGDRLLVVGPAHPADGAHGLVVFDVRDRRDPEQVAAYELASTVHNCDFDGRYAYLTANARPGNPLVVVDTEREREAGTWSLVDADERWAEVPRGLRPLHDVWAEDGRAYLAYWDAGTWILDVSDPTEPALLSRVRGRSIDALADVETPRRERSEPPGNDHFVTVGDDGDLLGVGAEAWDVEGDGTGGPGGIELFDISDPAAPESLATIEPPPTSDATFGGVLTTAHNFELTGDRCYSAWYQGGVRVHDLRDPTAPEELFAWRDSDRASFWTARRGDGCFVAAGTDANPGASEFQPALYTFRDPPEPTPTPGPTDGGGDESLGAGGPGVGVLGTLAALGLAGWRAVRRER